MDDDYEIVELPLSQKITRNGMTVEVLIYRGPDDDGWILEVVDQEDASTVWDDHFPTDQAALDEVILTIERDGIASFLKNPTRKNH